MTPRTPPLEGWREQMRVDMLRMALRQVNAVRLGVTPDEADMPEAWLVERVKRGHRR